MSWLRRRPAVTLVVLICVLFVAGACSGTDRPATTEWSSTWQAIRGGIPDFGVFQDGADEEACVGGLRFLRDRQEELFPTPDESLDGPVRTWLQTAEDIFFECPPTEAFSGFAGGYAELDRLAAQIDSGLEP